MLLNKIFITIILIVGILLGNIWVSVSVIPAVIVNIFIYLLIISSKQEYPALIRKKLLARDIDLYINKNMFMQILIFVSRLCLAISFGYIAYIVSTKLFGFIQL